MARLDRDDLDRHRLLKALNFLELPHAMALKALNLESGGASTTGAAYGAQGQGEQW